jgi:peptidyl-prolyl cis-trans isomerase C
MRVSNGSGLVSLLATGCALALAPIGASGQAQPKSKAQPPAAPAAKVAAPPAAKTEAPTRPPNLDQPVAVVNGEKITKGDLIRFLSSYPVPPLSREQIYHDAVETLINTRLVGQFLERQNIPVPPEKRNEAIAQFERELKSEGRELATALQESGQTMDDLRRELGDRLLWVEFVKIKATDAELKRFATTHKDLVSGTQIKVSHIYLKVEPDAPAAEKDKTRARLLELKKQIEDKKIGFAEAANKNSQDPANAEGSGGDIGYIGLNSGVVEEFAKAAFDLKPGQISDPVETIHGLHLIVVTDRKEGNPVDFEQQKTLILQLYAADLQKQILTAQRQQADEKHAIEIKPMPADLFPPEPPASTTPAPAGAAPGAAKQATPK